jgi:hypothetical protein
MGEPLNISSSLFKTNGPARKKRHDLPLTAQIATSLYRNGMVIY